MSGARGSRLIPATSYEVGYGKPPKASRFKPGQSGNPKGRPKGSKNKRPGMHEERLKEIILDEAYRGITVRDGDRNVTIPMAQAVIRSMAVSAAKGQHRAQRLFAELLAATETSRKQLHDQYFETALTYKLSWENELERRKQAGITHLPDPIPHPNQGQLDMREGTVRLRGPITREELSLVNDWREKLVAIEEAVEQLKESLEEETAPLERGDTEKHIEVGEKLAADIRGALGEPHDS